MEVKALGQSHHTAIEMNPEPFSAELFPFLHLHHTKCGLQTSKMTQNAQSWVSHRINCINIYTLPCPCVTYVHIVDWEALGYTTLSLHQWTKPQLSRQQNPIRFQSPEGDQGSIGCYINWVPTMCQALSHVQRLLGAININPALQAFMISRIQKANERW